MFFVQFEELNVITGTSPYLLYAGLIVDPVIEDILVLEEQDFNPSLVVVAVSGWDPVWGQSVQVETSSEDNAVQMETWYGDNVVA